ncbi:MAG TPA: tetratricopeptide repeat protein, partial [Nitrosopumilaceae archaeon]|nr:tetratricopeptide repeat protein [Nitrosopumilaceae archaeon]
MYKGLLVILLIIFGSLLISCGNKTKETSTEIITVDSSISKLNSPELKAVNAELLKNPNNPELYFKRAKLYIKNKDGKAAQGDAKRAIHLDSLKSEYFILLSDAYFFNNETRLAKETLERCLKINPESTEANLKLAELYFFVKKYPEAIAYANEALKINQNLGRGYFIKGMCYAEKGDTGNAVSSFQTVVEMDNQYYDAYMQLGLIMANKKNPIAVEYYTNALRINPKSAEVFYDIGKFYQDIRKFKQAVETYQKLLSLNPKEKNAIY